MQGEQRLHDVADRAQVAGVLAGALDDPAFVSPLPDLQYHHVREGREQQQGKPQHAPLDARRNQGPLEISLHGKFLGAGRNPGYYWLAAGEAGT